MDGLAYVFPGQGSQCIGMGVAMANMFPEARAVFDDVSAVTGWDVYQLCCSGPASRLTQTDYLQPALMAAGLACFAAAKPRLPMPVAAAGLSLGEYMAYVAAGVMSLDDAVGLVAERGRLMAEACRQTPSGMVAVMGLSADVLEMLVAESAQYGVCAIANDNAPFQQVVGGEATVLEYLVARAEQAGAFEVRTLNVAGAFHTPLMASAAEAYREYVERVVFHPAQMTVVSNLTGDAVSSPHALRRLLVDHVTQPVQWRKSAQTMAAGGVKHFIECGPGKVLSNLIRKTVKGAKTYPVSCPDSLARAYGWFELNDEKSMLA